MVEFKVYKHSNLFYPEVLVTVGVDVNEEFKRPSWSEISIVAINRQNVFEEHLGLIINCPVDAARFISSIEKLSDYFYRDALERAKGMINYKLVCAKHNNNPLYQSYLTSGIKIDETNKMVLLSFFIKKIIRFIIFNIK